eukprot:UN25339
MLRVRESFQGKEHQQIFDGLLNNGDKNDSVARISKTKLFELNETLFDDKFKTELCVKFMAVGVCPYGPNCNFAHGEKQLKSRVRHPNFKTRVCTRFLQEGKCPYGIRCTFIHDKTMKPMDATQMDKNPKIKRNYKTKPCALFFKTGRCAYGDKCTFIHEMKEAKLNPLNENKDFVASAAGNEINFNTVQNKRENHASGCFNVITVPVYENDRIKMSKSYWDFKAYHALKPLRTVEILKD